MARNKSSSSSSSSSSKKGSGLNEVAKTDIRNYFFQITAPENTFDPKQQDSPKSNTPTPSSPIQQSIQQSSTIKPADESLSKKIKDELNRIDENDRINNLKKEKDNNGNNNHLKSPSSTSTSTSSSKSPMKSPMKTSMDGNKNYKSPTSSPSKPSFFKHKESILKKRKEYDSMEASSPPPNKNYNPNRSQQNNNNTPKTTPSKQPQQQKKPPLDQDEENYHISNSDSDKENRNTSHKLKKAKMSSSPLIKQEKISSSSSSSLSSSSSSSSSSQPSTPTKSKGVKENESKLWSGVLSPKVKKENLDGQVKIEPIITNDVPFKKVKKNILQFEEDPIEDSQDDEMDRDDNDKFKLNNNNSEIEKQRQLEKEKEIRELEREKQRQIELKEKERQRQLDLEKQKKQEQIELKEKERQKQLDLEKQKEKEKQQEQKKKKPVNKFENMEDSIFDIDTEEEDNIATKHHSIVKSLSQSKVPPSSHQEQPPSPYKPNKNYNPNKSPMTTPAKSTITPSKEHPKPITRDLSNSKLFINQDSKQVNDEDDEITEAEEEDDLFSDGIKSMNIQKSKLASASKASKSTSTPKSKSTTTSNKDSTTKTTTRGTTTTTITKSKKPIVKKEKETEDEEKPAKEKPTKETPKKNPNPHAKKYAMGGSRDPPPNPGSKPIPIGKPNCLKWKTFLVTGVMDCFERDEIHDFISKYGGSIAKSVTKAVTHVIAGVGAGESKMKKITKKIQVINEDQFLAMINDSLKDMIQKQKKEEEDVSDEIPEESDEIVDDDETEDDQKQEKDEEELEKEEEIEEEEKEKEEEKVKVEKQDEDEIMEEVKIENQQPTISVKMEIEDNNNSQDNSQNNNNSTTTTSTTNNNIKPTNTISLTRPKISLTRPVLKPFVPPPVNQNQCILNTKEYTNMVNDDMKRTMNSLSMPSSFKSIPKGNDQLWVEKYKPKTSHDLVGNPGMVANIRSWLNAWGTERQAQKKALLISGPPGIGKTSTAIMLCKELGFEPLELNASDCRNKSEIDKMLSGVSDNRSIFEFFKPINSNTNNKPKRSAIIMDEIDGSSGNEDRGGIKEIIQMIKDTKIPFICICNDYYNQKIKSLKNHCEDVKFKRPTSFQARERILQIAKNEGMMMNEYMADKLFESTHSDIRQTINLMQMLNRSSQKLTMDNVQERIKLSGKDFDTSPFNAAESLLRYHGDKQIEESLESFFTDHSLIPLFVQENYIHNQPKNQAMLLKYSELELMSMAADSISQGNLFDNEINRNQRWDLLPAFGVVSTVIPSTLIAGNTTQFLTFPSFLGKFSNANKQARFIGDIQIHMRASAAQSFTNKKEARLYYVPMLKDLLIQPLVDYGKDGVQDVMEVMDEYGLTEEDRNSIGELSSWEKKDVFDKIDSQVKTSFTKKWRAGQHSTYDVSLLSSKSSASSSNGAQVLLLDEEGRVNENIQANTSEESDQEQSEDEATNKLIKKVEKKKTTNNSKGVGSTTKKRKSKK